MKRFSWGLVLVLLAQSGAHAAQDIATLSFAAASVRQNS